MYTLHTIIGAAPRREQASAFADVYQGNPSVFASERAQALAGTASEQSLLVLTWASSQPIAAQFVSAITMLELELGVLQTERKGRGTGRGLADMARKTRLATVRRPHPGARSGCRVALRATACA
jgi:hypothetical protein